MFDAHIASSAKLKYTEIDKLNADFNAALADMKSNVRDIIDYEGITVG